MYNPVLYLGSSLHSECEFGCDKPAGDHQCAEPWGEHTGVGDRLQGERFFLECQMCIGVCFIVTDANVL